MTTNIVASWRPEASKYYKADAQKVAEEFLSVCEKKGADGMAAVPREDILDMARDENTESHKLFEWNDAIAAEKFRLEQVRFIMHDLQIVKIGLNKNKPAKNLEIPVRLFYRLDGEVGYRATPVIIQNEDTHKKLLRTALNELEAFTKKYAILSELKPVLDEISRRIIELKIYDKVS